jgi:hypothetical protein
VTLLTTSPAELRRRRTFHEDPWRLNRRTVVLALAGVTALTEVAAIAGMLPALVVGGLPLSLSVLPAMALACACGSRLLGRSAIRPVAAVFWSVTGALAAVAGLAFARAGNLDLYGGWMLAALNEELVYRLAIPAVVATSLRLGNVRPHPARVAGLASAGLLFVVLPGHLEQMAGPAGPAPYIAFAALSAFVVYRSGSILPMALAHATANLLTALMWKEAVPADARSLGVASVLSLLVLAYGRPARIAHGDHGGLIDTQTGLAVVAIDLRDNQHPMLELEDGRVLPIHGSMVKAKALRT